MSMDSDHQPGRRPDTSVSLCLTAALISLVASAFHIRHSLVHRALALPPPYDDVAHLLGGTRYLDCFGSEGFGAFLRTFAAPSHAPLSTGAALNGFSLVGFHMWVGACRDPIDCMTQRSVAPR